MQGFIAAATYRVTDPIENLQLQVTLRKHATEGEHQLRGGDDEKAKAALRRKSVTLQGKRNADGAEASDNEVENGGEARPLRIEREEEDELVCPPRTFRWQEKAFSRDEVRWIHKVEESASGRARRASWLTRSLPGAVSSPMVSGLSNHLRAELARLDHDTRKNGQGAYEGETIFTHVQSEQYTDLIEWSAKFTDSASEVATPLARAILAGSFVRQHRDMLGEAACVSMYILATLPSPEAGADGEKLKRSGLGLSSTFATRKSSLGSEGTSEPNEEDTVLCVLRLYPQGRLDMRPPLSVEPQPPGTVDDGAPRLATWYAVPGTRYEYKLENLSETLGASAYEQEALGERLAKLSLSVSQAPRPLAELVFDSPPRKGARAHLFLTLESATNFPADALHVAYYALAAPGWRLLPHCIASAVTQTSCVRGEDECAVLGFPIELVVESEGPPTNARPPLSLFFSVGSRDVHDRMMQLGYAHVAPSPEAGSRSLAVQAWRLTEMRTDALRRFFVGGADEIADLRAITIPDGFDMTQPQCLNKHGLQTQTSGTLHLRVHTVVQQQLLPIAKALQCPTAPSKPRPAPVAPDFRQLRGLVGVSTLARSESAADRVIKRLEERRRTEKSFG